MRRRANGQFAGAKEPAVNSQPIPFRDLLVRIAHGYSWQDIADEYDVSRDSVKWRVNVLHVHLGVSDRAHAVQRGHTIGLIGKCADDCEFCLKIQ